MLNENAKKWVAALRSGQYQQGKERLRNHDQFCCLGVACDLYSKEMAIPWREEESGWYLLGESMVLPDVVAGWLGILTTGTYFQDDTVPWESSHFNTQLSSKNDRGSNFSEIADIIESEPKRLFAK